MSVWFFFSDLNQVEVSQAIFFSCMYSLKNFEELFDLLKVSLEVSVQPSIWWFDNVDSHTIFFFTKVEVEEALDKVILTLKNFGAFRDAFCEFKGKLPTYFKEDKKPKTWDFQEHLIFKRLTRVYLGQAENCCGYKDRLICEKM